MFFILFVFKLDNGCEIVVDIFVIKDDVFEVVWETKIKLLV